jgi:hypothetical protein
VDGRGTSAIQYNSERLSPGTRRQGRFRPHVREPVGTGVISARTLDRRSLDRPVSWPSRAVGRRPRTLAAGCPWPSGRHAPPPGRHVGGLGSEPSASHNSGPDPTATGLVRLPSGWPTPKRAPSWASAHNLASARSPAWAHTFVPPSSPLQDTAGVPHPARHAGHKLASAPSPASTPHQGSQHNLASTRPRRPAHPRLGSRPGYRTAGPALPHSTTAPRPSLST